MGIGSFHLCRTSDPEQTRRIRRDELLNTASLTYGLSSFPYPNVFPLEKMRPPSDGVATTFALPVGKRF